MKRKRCPTCGNPVLVVYYRDPSRQYKKVEDSWWCPNCRRIVLKARKKTQERTELLRQV